MLHGAPDMAAQAVGRPTTGQAVPTPKDPRMSLDQQTGVRVYQFIVDRLEDRRREQYPDGREAYEADWTAAHDLEKDVAEAVHADDPGTAERLLQELNGMAAQWRCHPHHPDNRTEDGSQPDGTALGSRP